MRASKILPAIITLIAIMSIALSVPFNALADDNTKVKGEKVVTTMPADTTLDLVIENTQKGDVFTVTRVIKSDYTGTALERSFENGFHYGNGDADDSGLNDYLSLDNASDIEYAAKQFADQVTDDSGSITVDSNGDQTTVKNLLLGQYVVTGHSGDGSRTYQVMMANMEPSVQDQSYVAVPITISAKYSDVVNPPELTINKDVDTEQITPGDTPKYTVTAEQTVKFGTAHNVHISDALDDKAVSAGMRLNKDVVVKDEKGTVIDSAKISYDENNGVTGFRVDLENPMEYGDKVVIEYTGDTSRLTGSVDIENVATVWSDENSGVADDAIVTSDSSGLRQTGDSLAYLVLFSSVTAIAVAIILAARSRRNK